VLAVTEAEQSAMVAQTQLQQAQQDFDTTWDFSRNRYPELNDPNSAMYKEVARLDAEMQELGDPLANDPKRLWDLAKRAGLNTRTPMTKPRDTSSAPAKGKNGSPVQPASGNRGTTTTDPSKRAAEVIAGIKTADDYERIVASLG
jgi:type II secretory pathway pseudopilin PulG